MKDLIGIIKALIFSLIIIPDNNTVNIVMINSFIYKEFFEESSSRKEINHKNYTLLKILKQLIEEKKLQVYFFNVI